METKLWPTRRQNGGKKKEDLKKGKASSGKGKCFCCGKLGYYETMHN
jgi:hypothetical protein